jgi:3-isopropylmalate/(R)-2-methylmalate dehydratase small subunit
MEKFTRLTATACPIDMVNLNTDQLLPARYLKLPRSAGLGQHLFHDLRRDAEGHQRPEFPLNRAPWRNAQIIVGGRNFGCGSSREAAVYALYDTVDLETQTIVAGNRTLSFTIDPVRRTRLLNGWDDIALTGSYGDQIASFKAADRVRRPWAFPAA